MLDDFYQAYAFTSISKAEETSKVASFDFLETRISCEEIFSHMKYTKSKN